MSTNDFALWLQGYIEITNGAYPDETQWQIIKDHLKEVFDKQTPDRHGVSRITLGLGDVTKITHPIIPITC